MLCWTLSAEYSPVVNVRYPMPGPVYPSRLRRLRLLARRGHAGDLRAAALVEMVATHGAWFSDPSTELRSPVCSRLARAVESLVRRQVWPALGVHGDASAVGLSGRSAALSSERSRARLGLVGNCRETDTQPHFALSPGGIATGIAGCRPPEDPCRVHSSTATGGSTTRAWRIEPTHTRTHGTRYPCGYSA